MINCGGGESSTKMLVTLSKKSFSFQNFIHQNDEATNVMEKNLKSIYFIQDPGLPLSLFCFVMENTYFSITLIFSIV